MQNFTLVGVGARSQQQETSQMLLRLRSRASLLRTAEAAAARLSSARLQYVTCDTLYIRLYNCELTGADAARKAIRASRAATSAALLLCVSALRALFFRQACHN